MTTDPPDLWHFTSTARARDIDRGGGWLLTGHTLMAARGMDLRTEGGRYVWLISEPHPTARLLGFRDATDHMAVRYRVLHPEAATWWPARRRQHSRAYVATLESHALPLLWWVADEPVQVVRDPAWTGRPAFTRS